MLLLKLTLKYTRTVLSYSYYWQGWTSIWKWLSLCFLFCLAYYVGGERRKLLVGRSLFYHVLKFLVSSPSLCRSGHCKQNKPVFCQALLGGWTGRSGTEILWLNSVLGTGVFSLFYPFRAAPWDVCMMWMVRERKGKGVRRLLLMPWCRLLVGIFIFWS